MLHGAGGTGGLPPSPCLHPVVDTFLFYANLSFFLCCPPFFLCSMAQVGRGVSLHLHVSILLSTRFFIYANLSFSYAVHLFFLCSMAQVGRGVSRHLHVSILLSTRFFFFANLSFSYAVSLLFLCSMAQVGRGVSLHLHVSILLSTRFFFMLICPFLMLSHSFFLCSMAQVGRGVSLHLHVSILLSTRFFIYANLSFSYAVSLFFLCSMAQVGWGVSLHLHVSIPLSTRFFFMLICPFLMLSPSFSYAPWRRWDGGSPSISMSPSCCRHVSLFMLICPFFSYAVHLFFLCSMAQVGRGVSLHLHVAILLSTRSFFMLICPFLMLSPSLSYAPWRRWDGGSPAISMSPSCCRHVFFHANLSFSYAVSLLFLCSMAQVGREVSLHLHVSILLSTRFFLC